MPVTHRQIIETGDKKYAWKVFSQVSDGEHEPDCPAFSALRLCFASATQHPRFSRSVDRTTNRAILRLDSEVAVVRDGFPAQDAEGWRPSQSSFRRDLCGVLHPVGSGQWLMYHQQDDGVVSPAAACKM